MSSCFLHEFFMFFLHGVFMMYSFAIAGKCRKLPVVSSSVMSSSSSHRPERGVGNLTSAPRPSHTDQGRTDKLDLRKGHQNTWNVTTFSTNLRISANRSRLHKHISHLHEDDVNLSHLREHIAIHDVWMENVSSNHLGARALSYCIRYI